MVTLRPVQPSWTTFLELPKAEDEYLQERSVVMAERSAGRDALPGFVKVVHLNSADATQLQGSALERDAELSADALGSAWARSHPVRIPITASRSTSRRPTPQRSPNSKRCSSALVSALSALSTHTPRYAGSSWRRGWRTWPGYAWAPRRRRTDAGVLAHSIMQLPGMLEPLVGRKATEADEHLVNAVGLHTGRELLEHRLHALAQVTVELVVRREQVNTALAH